MGTKNVSLLYGYPRTKIYLIDFLSLFRMFQPFMTILTEPILLRNGLKIRCTTYVMDGLLGKIELSLDCVILCVCNTHAEYLCVTQIRT